MHSKIELPVRSTILYPAWSMSAATSARWATFMRIPHRLCCPSRSVWSTMSTSAIGRLLRGQGGRHGGEQGRLEPPGGDQVVPEVVVRQHRPMKVARGLDTFDLEAVQRLQRGL